MCAAALPPPPRARAHDRRTGRRDAGSDEQQTKQKRRGRGGGRGWSGRVCNIQVKIRALSALEAQHVARESARGPGVGLKERARAGGAGERREDSIGGAPTASGGGLAASHVVSRTAMGQWMMDTPASKPLRSP